MIKWYLGSQHFPIVSLVWSGVKLGNVWGFTLIVYIWIFYFYKSGGHIFDLGSKFYRCAESVSWVITKWYVIFGFAYIEVNSQNVGLVI